MIVAPVIIDRLLVGDAQEVDIGAVDEAALAVELGHPHRHRRRIGDQPEPLLALAQPLLALTSSRLTAVTAPNTPAGAPLLAEDRIVAEGQPGGLLAAVAPQRPRRRIRRTGSRRPAPARHWADPVPDVRPDLAPAACPSAGRGRRGSRHSRHCGEQQVGAPADEHRHGRAEHHAGGGLQRLRPALDRPERRRRPVLRPRRRAGRPDRDRGRCKIGLVGTAIHQTLRSTLTSPRAEPRADPRRPLRRRPGPGAARAADCRP